MDKQEELKKLWEWCGFTESSYDVENEDSTDEGWRTYTGCKYPNGQVKAGIAFIFDWFSKRKKHNR